VALTVALAVVVAAIADVVTVDVVAAEDADAEIKMRKNGCLLRSWDGLFNRARFES